MTKQFRIDRGDGDQSFFEGVSLVELSFEEWFAENNFDLESREEFATRKLLLLKVLYSGSNYKYLAVDFVDFDPVQYSTKSGELFRTVLYGISKFKPTKYQLEGLGYSVIRAL